MMQLQPISLLRRNRSYRFLYMGQLVSFAGTMITSTAIPYQIYHQTGSVLNVGLLGICQLLPLLFTAMLGGVFADRYHRRKILIYSELFLAICALILALNSECLEPSMILLFITASLMSAITGLHRPAMDSLVQQLISKDDVPAASSLTMFLYSTCAIAGPALGGVLVSTLGLGITYSIDCISFFISIMALLQIKNISKPKQVTTESPWQSLKAGIRYATKRQELSGSYLVDFIAMIFGMPNALFPAVAEKFGGASTLGLLYAAPAVGALFVSFTGDLLSRFKRRGVGISISASLWGIAIIAFGVSENVLLALCFLTLAGAADAASGMFRSILWNETIPNHYRGRLAGIEMLSYMSGPRLGDAEAGFVASLFGISASIVSGGILCVIGVVACGCLLPKYWQYRAVDC